MYGEHAQADEDTPASFSYDWGPGWSEQLDDGGAHN
jgi:hypothetical protein